MRFRTTCATTSRLDSSFDKKRSWPVATAAVRRMTPPFSNTKTVVVNSLKSSRSPETLPARAPVTLTRTSRAAAFTFGSGLVFRGIPVSSPASSEDCAEEALPFNSPWGDSPTDDEEELCSVCACLTSTGKSSGAELEVPCEGETVEEALSSVEDKFVVLCAPGHARSAPEMKYPVQTKPPALWAAQITILLLGGVSLAMVPTYLVRNQHMRKQGVSGELADSQRSSIIASLALKALRNTQRGIRNRRIGTPAGCWILLRCDLP